MSSLTGAKSAKRAAEEQTKLAREQAEAAQRQAAEATRQAATQAVLATAREKAAADITAMEESNTPAEVKVDVTPEVATLQKRRAKFQAADAGAPSSIRI